MTQTKSAELRGVLNAYYAITSSSWPDLHEGLERSRLAWRQADSGRLQAELDSLLAVAGREPREVRVFWKFGDQLSYGGGNGPFARDAGFTDPGDLAGRTDFDPHIPWTRQAGKYQADDREVMENREPKLFILERQERGDGIFWLHTGKAPILDEHGESCGILGMYETITSRQVMELRRQQGQLV